MSYQHPALFVGIGPRECCYCFAESKGAYHHMNCSKECPSVLRYSVAGCDDCADGECGNAAHQHEALAGTTCNVCATVADHFALDWSDKILAACNAHAKFIPGWIRDAAHEVYCDSRAAADFEDRAYGRD